MADLFTWTETTGPSSLVFPVLPYHISLLPALFRVLAALVLVPVAILASVDILGWAYHRLLLRPLGYASTIRFKDPEPSTLVSVPAHDAGVQRAPPPGTKKAAARAAKLAGLAPSTGTGGPLDSVAAAVILPSSRSSSAGSSSGSSSSSSQNSPTIEYDSSCSPSQSPSAPAPKPLPTTLGLGPRPRSNSESSSSSMYRARAGSVGVEGPFLAGEDLPQSPACEDDDEREILGGPADSSESESEGGRVVRRRGRQAHAGMPRGGPAFGFTGMGQGD